MPSTEMSGPAIIEAMDSTTVVPPGWTARVDELGYLRLRRSGDDEALDRGEPPGRMTRDIARGRMVAPAAMNASRAWSWRRPRSGAGHNLAKANIWRLLREAIFRTGLSCQVFTDGMTLEIGDSDYEPDCVVRCGERPLPLMRSAVPDPRIVVEVLSPKYQRRRPRLEVE